MELTPENDDVLIGATPEQEKAWAVLAEQMGYHDFHRLDRCHCGGIYDCWTKHYTTEERQARGMLEVHYRSEWICDKCGDSSDQNYDADMHEI